jgi:fido (protein-threonine AMPylation protein)
MEIIQINQLLMPQVKTLKIPRGHSRAGSSPAIRSLWESNFQRAIFMMFLVAEVHPFSDGNGRLSRIMMNAELVSAGEQRIIVPTIYRANYLAALKAISNRTSSEPLIRTLDFAQRFSRAIDWRNFVQAETELRAANAFMDSAETANGATWLDRELIAKSPMPRVDSGFGNEVRSALYRRQQWLME